VVSPDCLACETPGSLAESCCLSLDQAGRDVPHPFMVVDGGMEDTTTELDPLLTAAVSSSGFRWVALSEEISLDPVRSFKLLNLPRFLECSRVSEPRLWLRESEDHMLLLLRLVLPELELQGLNSVLRL